MSQNRVPFGAAIVESGKNKGASRSVSFATSIAAENANGLPVNNGKVMLSISPAVITVPDVASADEVRALAGDAFDDFVVESFRSLAKQNVRNALTSEARKLTLPPSSVSDWAASIADAITHASLFETEERSAKKGPRGVKAEVLQLSQAAANMSHEDLLAAIAALTSKLK